ncbi:hypothetical protein GCM10028827_22180 [Mucilaginibacter myungsuensis]
MHSANEEKKSSKEQRIQRKAAPEKIKNKIWENKKGSYLCTPETNEGNFGETKRKADRNG